MKMKKKIETKYQTKTWKGHNNNTMFYKYTYIRIFFLTLYLPLPSYSVSDGFFPLSINYKL